MSGLPWFHFYPRDWVSDTRDLSQAAKGLYIDVLAATYARGAPLPFDERDLCRLTGCATARSLRPLLGELLEKQKLRLIDGCLVNGRAMEELAKIDRQKAAASKGGKSRSRSVQPEFGSNSARTRAETQTDIVENQSDDLCLPEPESDIEKIPPTEGAGPAPLDPKKELFDFGKHILGRNAGGQVAKLLRHYGSDVGRTMETLRLAAGKSDAREYIGAVLRGDTVARAESVLAETNRLYRELGVSS